MTTITVELEDDVMVKLRADAARAGATASEFVAAVIRSATAPEPVSDEVHAIMDSIISRYRDLFRRLAES